MTRVICKIRLISHRSFIDYISEFMSIFCRARYSPLIFRRNKRSRRCDVTYRKKFTRVLMRPSPEGIISLLSALLYDRRTCSREFFLLRERPLSSNEICHALPRRSTESMIFRIHFAQLPFFKIKKKKVKFQRSKCCVL